MKESRLSKICLVSSLICSSLILTSCFQNNITTFGNGLGTSSSTLASGASSVSTNTFSISSVSIPTPSSGSTYVASIYFNTQASSTSITNFCTENSTTGSSQLCLCQFSWQETLSGSTTTIQRSVQSALITVQPNLVTCDAPQVYSSEITNGTAISINVMAGPSNGSSFSMTPFSYTKNASATGGSFSDSSGDSFQNIVRYSCYEEYQRGLSVASQIVPITTNGTTPVTGSMYSASQLCVQSASSGSTTSSVCLGQLGNPGYTAQANYFNFYIPQSETGQINPGNATYKCPMVKESLANNGTVGTQGLPWPLDSTFALASSPTSNFTVGVQAFSAISDGDPSTASQSCYPAVSASSSPTSGGTSAATSSSFASSCLGFAMAPNSDGTCPYFKNSNNQVTFTYRLRRYVALYPSAFDTNGGVLTTNSGQSVDTIYVVDRPVTSPNPLQPYTMRGPKPCPFAYYDKKAVTSVPESDPRFDPGYLAYSSTDPTPNGCLASASASTGAPSYSATSNANWLGGNFDGIQLPNVDTVNSCSAVVALTSPDVSHLYMSIGTVSAANPAIKSVYVRPVTPWAPHYAEDTTFRACAPLASPFQDPPLHFSKDSSGNVSWCAEAYPSQNQNIGAIDQISTVASGTNECPVVGQYIGRVENFTSHAVKNSSSATCTATIPTPIPSNYPAATVAACQSANDSYTGAQGYARHPTNLVVDTVNGSNICAPSTCDRTVTSTYDWLAFPLIARPAQVEAAMAADSSYDCMITYDNNGSKTGKATPTGGCCGPNVYMTTGLTGNSSAHLEPDVACTIPTY